MVKPRSEMKLNTSILFLFLFLLFSISLQAQSTAKSKTGKEARELLETARDQMAAQDFQAANRSFRQMLELNTVLPTEMCYFFSNTLYMLGQYDNSLRFIEKYETLAGSAGEYYQESQELRALLKKELKSINACQYCDSQGYVLEDCRYCEGEGSLMQSCPKCFGHQRLKCEVCKGEGVVIKKNNFGKQNYHSCTICQGSGIQECPQCKGKGALEHSCRYCHGSGRIRTHHLCQHPRASN